jgi:protein-arginine kinase
MKKIIQDEQQCVQNWLIKSKNDSLEDRILFSDEIFHNCGKINRHNCRIWVNENQLSSMNEKETRLK